MKLDTQWISRAVWLAGGVLLGATISSAAAEANADSLYRKLEVLAEVLGRVETHYVDAVSPTELIYGAAAGITSQLDAHSAFFTPEEYRDLIDITEGEYAGIGIEISSQDGPAEVVAVFDGSPAQKAGIGPGDTILGVDGESTQGMDLDKIQMALRGPVGTRTVLSIRRRGRDEPRTFTLVRSWIRVAPLTHQSLTDGVEYVQVKTFARRVSSDLESTLEDHTPQRGLVLDLRGNPGGLFDEAVAICDLFLRDGPIVTAIGKGGRVIDRQEAHERGTEPGYPVAILVDGGSASAAEIVAAALHDRGRARLFGNRTYGKGSVQSILDLSDGSGLKLTVARYVTPAGFQIDGRGVVPDQVIDVEGEGENEDRALDAATAWIAEN